MSGSGYFFAGVGIALVGWLTMALALQGDGFAYLLGWAIDSGLGPVVAVVAVVLTVGAGIVIAWHLAKGRNL